MLPVIKNSADAPSDKPPASTSKVSCSIGSTAGMPCSSPVVALMYEPFMATDVTDRRGFHDRDLPHDWPSNDTVYSLSPPPAITVELPSSSPLRDGHQF